MDTREKEVLLAQVDARGRVGEGRTAPPRSIQFSNS